ncbi:hypothetical protein F0U60_49265 [Archangium minus]|uniref:Lipoprotein n=1 Tax=Archangium minus TaxID=83450 RepID=A0ABY9X774_9BACT|nr:hypothetical protein F0U61_49340 [Archangium violaceum]WNG51244.1 hypothetical protein F0U60_49265 [Archangium minus]
MPRHVWILGGLVWWTACPGNDSVDPEQRKKELQACILQRVPPAEATATEWKVSGYMLVDAYVKCQEKPEQATAADFRAVVQEIAQLEADSASVRITALPGGTQ